ncbi:MAG: hypothetical protein BMS9Abin05_2038 [Rhodothermia bacterium]|nr:MAG: hypothetical protein BMS9Abin05_2038 [Rhodothermia bacterium]
MRKLYLLFIPLLFAATIESSAQVNTIAQVWTMEPMFGHTKMVEDALREHGLWRKANGDTWNWDVFQVVNGDNFGIFYARSGDHTWADLDNYQLEGASDHFNATVLPHLKSVSNSLTKGNPEATYMISPEEVSLYQVVWYDVIPSKQFQLLNSIGKFSEIIRKSDSSLYHAFAEFISGGNGSSLLGVFPRSSWADFEEPDPSIGELLSAELGEDGSMALFEQFTTSIRGQASSVLLHRKDLSSAWIE